MAKIKKNWQEMTYGEKIKAAEAIGEKVGAMVQKTLDRANKFLAQYGFKVTAQLDFHYLNENEDEKNETSSVEAAQQTP